MLEDRLIFGNFPEVIANLEEAETVLALTNDDEDNLMVSVLVEKFAKDDKKIDIFVHNKAYPMEFSVRDIGR